MRRNSPHISLLLNLFLHDMVYIYAYMRRFSPHIFEILNHMQDAHQNPSPLVPYGLVVSRRWLMGKGIQRHTIDNWVKSGKLVAVARGVFKRPDTELTWQGAVCSLQYMGSLLMPGGLTALTLQGMTHYLSPGEQKTIHLYGHEQLPAWMNALLPGTVFVHHKRLDMDSGYRDSEPGSHLFPWTTQYVSYDYEKRPMHISSPELAILQVLLDVPRHVSFEHADQLVQGLPTLSPRKLSMFLERCHNVKVKRLFFWLAEKNQSPWLKKMDLQKFSMESGALGSGKRMIAEGGRLDPKYLITVPQDMQKDSYDG
jgi:hypothetical protein